MINWQCLLLPLFTVRQYLFCANSIVCYSFKTHPNKNKISLYKYLPEKILENVVEFDIKDVNLYNLKLIGNGVNIISGDDEFVCYYPSKFKFKLPSNEQVILIDEEKVYINTWIEEDFDEENNCAGDNYKYYEKLVIRDFWGRFISEEIGNLNKAEDGNWWIS